MQGPNFAWHMDGYDKLAPFGFYVHGCVDGYITIIVYLSDHALLRDFVLMQVSLGRSYG